MISEDDVRKSLAGVLHSDRPMTWALDYRFLGDSVDSLDHAAFVLELQESRGLVVPDEDLGRLDTIANVLAYAGGKS